MVLLNCLFPEISRGVLCPYWFLPVLGDLWPDWYLLHWRITKRKPNCISNCRSFCPADQKPFAFCANIERGTPLFKCFVSSWHFFSPRVRSITTTNVVFAAKWCKNCFNHRIIQLLRMTGGHRHAHYTITLQCQKINQTNTWLKIHVFMSFIQVFICRCVRFVFVLGLVCLLFSCGSSIWLWWTC